ncbi:hypothetical protein BDR22DRAFT_824923 [Usnea florida]
MLARYFGVEVFISLGSADKRDFIRETYGILESYIFLSRDTTFETGILRATNGRGVDIDVRGLRRYKINAEELVKALPPIVYTVIAYKDTSYLITGGTRGIGRLLAYWLAKNGARNIVLISRSGLSSALARAFIKDIKALHATIQIVVRACDIGNRG